MIEKLNIEKFGSFSNFSWDQHIQEKKFKKLNVIYGRNYSGKTTLSRVFRSFETGKLPRHFEYSDFQVESTEGHSLNQSDCISNNLDIRVFNKDFVDENLSFLRDSDGSISSFAVLGSENKEIEERISECEFTLGSVENKTGLLYRLHQKQEELNQAKKAHQDVDSELTRKLTNQANQVIKHNTIYKDPNYNINKIKADTKKVIDDEIQCLSEKEIAEKKLFLSESSLVGLQHIPTFQSDFDRLFDTSKSLLEKSISPTKSIQELINDSLLQAWVKEGQG